jgi:hypothetical protein
MAERLLLPLVRPVIPRRDHDDRRVVSAAGVRTPSLSMRHCSFVEEDI